MDAETHHLCNLKKLDSLMIKPSIDILMKKNDKLVLHEELFGSSAGDIENKSRNDRKAGSDSDDPMADTFASSHSGCLFRMCLCMKGETEMDIIFVLVNRVPNLKSISHDVNQI